MGLFDKWLRSSRRLRNEILIESTVEVELSAVIRVGLKPELLDKQVWTCHRCCTIQLAPSYIILLPKSIALSDNVKMLRRKLQETGGLRSMQDTWCLHCAYVLVTN
jgi:hypothetical protein